MRIKNFEVSGIKNLNKAYIEFANKGLKEEQSLVKLIYGSMGSGKSAMIEAISMYLSLSDRFKDANSEEEYILSVMSSKTIEFCVSFLRNGKEYYHEIDITNYDNKLVVSRELILEGNKVIYEYKEKKIIVKDIFKNPNAEIDENSSKSVFIFGDMLANIEWTFSAEDGSIDEEKGYVYNENRKKNLLKEEYYYGLSSTHSFIPTKYDGLNNLKSLKNKNHRAEYKSLFSSGSKGFYNETFDNQKYYNPSNYEQMDVQNLLKFIQIFNANIIAIELINYERNEDEINTDFEIIYNNYRIPLSLESIGLKKIIRYYELLLFSKGSILIIDDFDVFLTEKTTIALQEFIVKYCDAQVIFSVNNVNLMQVVKNHKKSISFMDNGRVLNWRKNGNENPVSMYLSNKIVEDNISAEEINNILVENVFFRMEN